MKRMEKLKSYLNSSGRLIIVLLFLFSLSSFLLISHALDQRTQGLIHEGFFKGSTNDCMMDAQASTLKTQSNALIDEVHTFTTPQDEWSKMVSLEEEYLHYISVELVTPHNCLMKISVEDPAEHIFNVFENDMFYEPEYGRSYEIPFGAAQSGTYNITFHVESASNLNIHVKIEESIKCLHDKMGLEAIENVIFYEVTTFDNDQAIYIEYDIDLKKDTIYDFYIGRVSAISSQENSLTTVDDSITDPNGVEFTLYSGNYLAGVNEVNRTFFGTSINGTHVVKIIIYCNVEYVNVAYAIVEDHSLSDSSDQNEVDTPPSDETSSVAANDDSSSSSTKYTQGPDATTSAETFNTTAELPLEMTIGTIASVGGTLGTMMIALFTHRRKNKIKI